MTLPLALLVALGTALWGSPLSGDSAIEGGASCRPTEGSLSRSATLAGGAGTFRLIMVRPLPGGEAEAASGALVLSVSTLDPSAFAPASTPLQGATDLDLRAVGAFPIGNPGSTAPAAPGVLVLESVHEQARRILLRLGSDANRPGVLLYDGGHTVLEVREIDDTGFAGTWRSRSGRVAASGHFCASRTGG